MDKNNRKKIYCPYILIVSVIKVMYEDATTIVRVNMPVLRVGVHQGAVLILLFIFILEVEVKYLFITFNITKITSNL